MTGAQSLSLGSTHHGNSIRTLTLRGCWGGSPLKGSAETEAQPQGKTFPSRSTSMILLRPDTEGGSARPTCLKIGYGDGVAEGENHTGSHDEVGLVCGISVVSQRKDKGGRL